MTSVRIVLQRYFMDGILSRTPDAFDPERFAPEHFAPTAAHLLGLPLRFYSRDAGLGEGCAVAGLEDRGGVILGL